jgi:MFS family permease
MTLSVLKNKSYLFILSSNFIQKITGNIYDLSMPLLILYYTGSPILMGLMYAIGFVAEFISSYFGGFIIDRFNRKTLLIIITISQAVAVSSLPLLDYLNDELTFLVFVVAFIVDILMAMYALTDISIIPQIVEKNDLPKANGYMQVAVSTALAIGPSIAGFLIGVLSPQQALWISVGGFLLLILTLRLIEVNQSQVTRMTEKENIFTSSKKGLVYTLSNDIFRKILIWNAFINLGLTGSILMLVFHLTKTIGVNSFTLGIILTFAAIGGILSGLSLPKIQAVSRTGLTMFSLSMISGFALVFLSWVNSVPLICLAVMIIMFVIGINSRLIHLLFQIKVPDNMLGRVFGASRLISTILAPVSVLASGWISENYSSNLVFLLGGVIIILTNVVIITTRVRDTKWGIVMDEQSA